MPETTDVKALRAAQYNRRKGTGKAARVVVKTRSRDTLALRQRVENEVENREFRLALASL